MMFRFVIFYLLRDMVKYGGVGAGTRRCRFSSRGDVEIRGRGDAGT